MITKLRLKNFKSIGEQIYEFTSFDLLVGRNNSGKSTVLQALAIWQFCVEEFHQSNRTGSKGIQIVLPNFTALPVPEFNYLWRNRTDRHWPVVNGKKKQEYILIEIHVDWLNDQTGEIESFGVDLRYHSPQTIYAIPSNGWSQFHKLEKNESIPLVVYVPPFSGIEPTEQWIDEGPLRRQIGKAQPGSVLRNVLLRVFPDAEFNPNGSLSKKSSLPENWKELTNIVKRWFSVDLLPPRYDQGKDVNISVEYKESGKKFDIISGGSGFHQTLTLLAFLFGYHPTTILFDEPDAHLHANLQREILDFFKLKSNEIHIQFLIATHSQELISAVDSSQIVSLLQHQPVRVESTPQIIQAMSDIANEEITKLQEYQFILYVEGETDERILRAWAKQCNALDVIDKFLFKKMHGGSKNDMKLLADRHYSAIQQIIPTVKRLLLFDYDNDSEAFHPAEDNPVLIEWKRKNIENYLLVPDAWKRTALNKLRLTEDNLFSRPVYEIIDSFFKSENLTLPEGSNWKDLNANIFKVVDGKSILFEEEHSLFHQIQNGTPPALLIREEIALNMLAEEIHQDVHAFFLRLTDLVKS